MIASLKTVGGLVGSAALILAMAGCAGGSKASYRFELMIEVDTPDGIGRGSSVYEVTARNRPGLDPSGVVREWRVKGEALAVDLPSGGTLFALLKTNAIHQDMAGLSMTSLDPAFKNDVVESAQRLRKWEGVRSPSIVPSAAYPMFITFADISEPKTVKLVHFDSLDDVFEAGVQLRRVTVQLTDKPVTLGIERRLSWLPEVYHRLRGVEFNPPGIPVGDFKSLFSSELSK